MRASGRHLVCGIAVALAGCSLVSLDSLQDFDATGAASSAATTSDASSGGGPAAASSGSTGSASSSATVAGSTSAQSGSGGEGGAGGTGGTGGAGPLTPYADAVLADGPIAYLHLDELAVETVAVDAVGLHDGAIVGGVTREQPSAVADAGGRSMRFDGSSGALVLGDVLDFPKGTPFSIELWAKRAAVEPPLGHLEWIVSKEVDLDDDRKGYCLLITDDLRLGAEVWFGASNARVAYHESPITLDVWHHVVVVGDAGSLFTYVDGIQYGTGGDTAGLPDTTGALIFAAQAGQQNHFDGWLDEIAVYDTILDGTQIVEHFTAAQ